MAAWWRRTPRARTFPVIETTPSPRPVRRSWAASEWSDLTADWPLSTPTGFQLVFQGLGNLRARARYEYRRNDYARRFVGMLKNGVVGPDGFALQCQFEDPRGPDEVANDAFEAHWRKWANDPNNCDVQRRSTFTQQCRQIVGQLAMDGEILIRKWTRGPMGFQLQVIDPVLLDVTYHDRLPNGNRVSFGIEIDGFGGALAYWFSNVNEWGHQSSDRVRVPADQVHHVYLTEFADQLRGIPLLATPSMRMHMVAGYENAALIAARVGAGKMGFIKRREPELYTGEQNVHGGAVDSVEPGTIGELSADEDWVPYDPTYPTGEFSDFVRQTLRGVASGLEVSYPTLANDLEGVNYTSLRHDSLTERDIYSGMQRWLIDTLLMPLWRSWLDVQLIRGVPIPKSGGGSRLALVQRREKYEKIRWQGRRWQWVDPLKEVQAAEKAISLGIETRAQCIRDRGRDPEEVFAEWEREIERFGPVAGSKTPTQEPEPDGDRTPGEGEQDGDQPGREDG